MAGRRNASSHGDRRGFVFMNKFKIGDEVIPIYYLWDQRTNPEEYLGIIVGVTGLTAPPHYCIQFNWYKNYKNAQDCHLVAETSIVLSTEIAKALYL